MVTPIVDLDALAVPSGKVTLHGTAHDVLPFDGASYHLLAQLQRAQAEKGDEAAPDDHLQFLELACRLAHRIVPTLTAEQVARLNDKQLAAILQIGAGQVETVQRAMKAQEGNVRPLVKKKGRARV